MRASTLVILAVFLFAGCASTPTIAMHEARVRDARQCEVQAEEYLSVAQNANDIRYLVIESCMALRGYVSK
ncbi:MAG: hypothetical protein ACRELS_07045 [Candidatus Rokuibacteriota bacterium]